MTPTSKEKAKELVEEFYSILHSDLFYEIVEPGEHQTIPFYKAKQCALKCVDEMIKEHELISENYKWQDERWKWLQEVKQEISKIN